MLDNAFAFGVGLSSLLICLVNLFYTLILKRTTRTQNKIFIVVLGILIANSVSGMLSAVCRQGVLPGETSQYLNEFSKNLYFSTHTALCPMFFYYVCSISGVRFRMNKIKTILYSALFVITELMALTNPLTNWVFTITPDLNSTRNWGEYLIYIAALFYFVMTFVIMFSSWEILSLKRKKALFMSFLLTAVGVVLQLIFKDLRVEVLAESIAFIGIMMAVEDEDDRIDYGMGFYNRAALNLDLKGWFHNGREMSLIVIKITNSEIISKMLGSENTYIMAEILNPYLTSLAPKQNIYSPTPGTYVLALFGKDAPGADTLAEEISERFTHSWEYKEKRLLFSTVVMSAKIPGKITNPTQFFYMLDTPIPDAFRKKVLKNDDLDYFIRRQSLESALSRGLDEGSFEVYYQPTYHINKTLHGAEALIRMHDREMGNLYPDEFIPVAEQIGLIDDIDDFVLEEVCKFLQTGIPQRAGMDCINVNLSVLQLMRPSFLERICGIVEKYGIEKKLINFEITESIPADDYDMLSDVVRQLKEQGFLFSMDDYGTGYSNVSAVFSLDLDVVKLDKSLLWNAQKSELGFIILTNTIKMIRQMKKEILVEGVETEDQIEMLTDLRVQYLQGFFFSRPIPKSEFIALIEKAEQPSQTY